MRVCFYTGNIYISCRRCVIVLDELKEITGPIGPSVRCLRFIRFCKSFFFLRLPSRLSGRFRRTRVIESCHMCFLLITNLENCIFNKTKLCTASTIFNCFFITLLLPKVVNQARYSTRTHKSLNVLRFSRGIHNVLISFWDQFRL